MNTYPFCQKVKHPVTRKESYRAGVIILSNDYTNEEKDIIYPAFGILGFRYSKVYTGTRCVSYCETNGLYPELIKYINAKDFNQPCITFSEPLLNTTHTSIHPSITPPAIIPELRAKYKTFLYNRKKGKITDGKIWAIRYQIVIGRSVKHIATDFSLNRRNINDIIKYYLVPLNEVTEQWYTWYHITRTNEDVKFDKKQKFKRLKKRRANIDEIEYILTKTLEGWKPIKIYNVLIQERPTTLINQEWVNNITKGTVRILQEEVDTERYKKLIELKQLVLHKHQP